MDKYLIATEHPDQSRSYELAGDDFDFACGIAREMAASSPAPVFILECVKSFRSRVIVEEQDAHAALAKIAAPAAPEPALPTPPAPVRKRHPRAPQQGELSPLENERARIGLALTAELQRRGISQKELSMLIDPATPATTASAISKLTRRVDLVSVGGPTVARIAAWLAAEGVTIPATLPPLPAGSGAQASRALNEAALRDDVKRLLHDGRIHHRELAGKLKLDADHFYQWLTASAHLPAGAMAKLVQWAEVGSAALAKVRLKAATPAAGMATSLLN